MNQNALYILGAPDPELSSIENMLREAGETVAYATVGGARVHPGNAYRATEVNNTQPLPDVDVAVAIECGGPAIERLSKAGIEVIYCDHHRPGDIGYGRPPREFLSASAIGQLASLLAERNRLPIHVPGEPGYVPKEHPARWWREAYGYVGQQTTFRYFGGSWQLGVPRTQGHGEWLRVPESIVYAAAADHCLHAAYSGECPGVDPDALMQWRIRIRADYQRRDPEVILRDVKAARLRILQAEEVKGLGYRILDLRSPSPIPELPEAAARERACVIAGPIKDRDGRKKLTLQGCSASQFEAFTKWASKKGIVDVYGDPARGFAGGYLP